MGNLKDVLLKFYHLSANGVIRSTKPISDDPNDSRCVKHCAAKVIKSHFLKRGLFYQIVLTGCLLSYLGAVATLGDIHLTAAWLIPADATLPETSGRKPGIEHTNGRTLRISFFWNLVRSHLQLIVKKPQHAQHDWRFSVESSMVQRKTGLHIEYVFVLSVAWSWIMILQLTMEHVRVRHDQVSLLKMGMDLWVTGWIKLGCKQRIILAS